jgi:hypothetical protein
MREMRSSQPVGEADETREAYHDAREILVRLANALENGLLFSAKKDGSTALGIAVWLLSGLNERVRIGEAVKVVSALTVWVEEDIASQAIRDGACALRMAAQLVNTLFQGPGAAGRITIQIRDDLVCWSDFVEMNVFPYGDNGPAAIRLAADLMKLTMCLM